MGGMSRRKGAVAERAAVNFLRGRGVPADRTSRGADVHGMGDIDGIPGVVIEVKSAKTPAPLAWLRQLDAEMAAADADTGVIWWKPSGVPMGDVPRWIAVHPLAVHQRATRRVPATRWAAECTDHGFATRAATGRTVHVSTVAGWMVRASLSGLIDGSVLQLGMFD